MDYRLYTKTIELFASKKEKGGYTMTPVKNGWIEMKIVSLSYRIKTKEMKMLV
ncbi:hypothetical protein [Staphylococcus warneri]|uniref:hypothetical protein n=1 Tax=Staphylococcus warneri TaxID=1292 RepID=UPI0013CF2BFF|nr:hypothetical protein [Staphylococcus warneri]